MDYASWAKRKATRAGVGLVPVEVDVHTATGVHKAIRYHRAEDAKKIIAEGKAKEIKEMGRSGGATPAVSVKYSKPDPDHPHGEYRTTVLAQEKVNWNTKAGLPVEVTVALQKEEKDHFGNGQFGPIKEPYSTRVTVKLDGNSEEHGSHIDFEPVHNPARPTIVADLGRVGVTKENYEKLKQAIAKVESHPEFKAYKTQVGKNEGEVDDYEKHDKAVENMLTLRGRST